MVADLVKNGGETKAPVEAFRKLDQGIHISSRKKLVIGEKKQESLVFFFFSFFFFLPLDCE